MEVYFLVFSQLPLDISSIAKKAVLCLFDALVLPVLGYGSNVWLPNTHFAKGIVKQSENQSSKQFLINICKDPLEKVHVAFLKWTMGVKKQTSNAPVWGDFGREPLGVRLIKQLMDYHNRLVLLESNNSSQLVKHAYVEQRLLHLSWYQSIMDITNKFDQSAIKQQEKGKSLFPNSQLIKERVANYFRMEWDNARKQNKKLSFYNNVKEKFALEPYLTLADQTCTKSVAQLRTSSHKLQVETGRYGLKSFSTHHKVCEHCSSDVKEDLELLAHLPFADLILETEEHVLLECQKFEKERRGLKNTLYKALNSDIRSTFESENVSEMVRFIKKIFNKRFPKKISKEEDIQTKGTKKMKKSNTEKKNTKKTQKNKKK